MSEPKFHPLANLFPLMEGEASESFTADVKTNGLREPITRYQGAILDGRNRWRACARAKVKPRYVEFEGTEAEALAFVISKNVNRRDLTKNQRALAAARVVETTHGGDRKSDQVANWQLDREKAAALFRVKLRTLDRARVVLDKGAPELVAKVESGKVAVSKAATIAERSRDEQSAWLADPKKQEAKWKAARLVARLNVKKAAPPKEMSAEEAEEDRRTARLAFLLRASEVIKAAAITCEPDNDVLQAARAATAAWIKTTGDLEAALAGRKTKRTRLRVVK